RVAAEQFCRAGSPVVTDDEQGSPLFEQGPRIAAERQRLMDVLDGLEAGDEVEPAALEDLRREESLVDERADVGLGGQAGCVRWLDPLDMAEARGEELLQKGSVAGPDVEGRAQAGATQGGE